MEETKNIEKVTSKLENANAILAAIIGTYNLDNESLDQSEQLALTLGHKHICQLLYAAMDCINDASEEIK